MKPHSTWRRSLIVLASMMGLLISCMVASGCSGDNTTVASEETAKKRNMKDRVEKIKSAKAKASN